MTQPNQKWVGRAARPVERRSAPRIRGRCCCYLGVPRSRRFSIGAPAAMSQCRPLGRTAVRDCLDARPRRYSSCPVHANHSRRPSPQSMSGDSALRRQQDPWYKGRAPRSIPEKALCDPLHPADRAGRNNFKEDSSMIDHIRRNILATGAAATAVAAAPQVFAQQAGQGPTKFYEKGPVRIAY
jgi:hypothetical protein